MFRKNVSAGKVNFIVFIIFVFILGGKCGIADKYE